MDMMTLALAKKYTDEKVGSGGGTSGGERVKINLADYGVEVFSLFVQGGGTATMTDAGAFSKAIETEAPIDLCIVGPNAYVETPATKLGSGTSITAYHSLTATIPIAHELGTFVCSLFARGSGEVKLVVTPA